MRLECPSCGHATTIPDPAVSEEGSTFRCPECSSSFTAFPGGFTKQPDGNASPSPTRPSDEKTSSEEPKSPSPHHSDPFGDGSEQADPPGASPGQVEPGSGSSPGGGSSGSGGSPARGQRASSRRAPEPEPGEVLANQFEIEGRIGRGAVATVYGATDRHLGEEVALKVIPTFGEPEAALRAIRPEYQAVRGLQDGQRHILHIDRPTVCEHSGMDMVLLPMERAEQSFRDWLEDTEADPGVEGRLEEGLALLRQACRGVEALHEQGLAHMDLKPENLLLTKNGRGPSEATEWTVKVADFGLARSLRRGEVLNEEVVAEGVGTPYYMAPEQVLAARQEEVGQEADLYALGIILFEMLDGKVPFDGSAERVREKHRTVDPPSVRTEVPGRLEALAHECLEKEAGDRPPSAGAIREELTLETSEERAAFERAREADTIEAWTGFIESYPEGWRTPDAEERLDELKREAEREEWGAEGERLAQEVASAIEKIELDPAADAPGIETAEEALGQLEEHVSSPPPAVEEEQDILRTVRERKQSLRARLEEKREALGERRRERQEELAERAEEAIEREEFEEADRLIEELRSVVGEGASEARRLKQKREKAWEACRERQEEKQEALIQSVEEAIAEKDLSRAEEKMTALRKEVSGKVPVDEARIERLDRQVEDLRDWLDTRKELVQAARGAIEDGNIDRAESKLTELKNHLGSEAGEDEKLADLTDDLDRLREKQKKIRRKIKAAEEAIEEERLQDADNEIQALKELAGADHSEVKRLREEKRLQKAKLNFRNEIQASSHSVDSIVSFLQNSDLTDQAAKEILRSSTTDEEKTKLLKNATEDDEPILVRLLLKFGMDPNIKVASTSIGVSQEEKNLTALHCAAVKGSPEVADVLIDRGATVDEKDDKGWTPLHWSAYKDRPSGSKFFVSGGGIDMENRNVYKESTPEMTKVLLANGAMVDASNRWGATPLHVAASKGTPEVVEVLISKGAVIDATDTKNETPLHKAAAGGHSRVAEMLVDAGAETEIRSNSKVTPIYEAASSDSLEVAKVLVRAGADTNAGSSPDYCVIGVLPDLHIRRQQPLVVASKSSRHPERPAPCPSDSSTRRTRP